MKKILVIITAISLTISCTESIKTNSVSELQSKKTSIVNKIDSLNKELKSIENELSKLDSNKKLQIVTTLPVKNETFKHFVEIQGVVKADKNIEIRPELGGTVNEIYVKEGQRVSKGQTLVQLDDILIKNNIDELKTQLELAKTTFNRQERLWKQNIGSEIQYLQAKTQKESLENSLESLKTQAQKMKIIAPFSGIVDEVFPKKGELTSAQTTVVRLVNLDKVYVEAEVTERYLPIIKKGTETVLNFPSLGKEINSKIAQTGNYINPENRSFRIKINIENKDQSIKPNLLANLKIKDFEVNGIIIPSNLVQQDQNGNNYVFTTTTSNNETKVVKNIITIGKEYNNEVYISDGLSSTDTLVNAGARLVKEGDLVKTTN